jgi:hypothetical protein
LSHFTSPAKKNTAQLYYKTDKGFKSQIEEVQDKYKKTIHRHVIAKAQINL